MKWRGERPVTPDEWERIKELFGAARTLAGAERAAFLDAACGADAVVRREVESLLAAEDSADGFMEGPAVASPGVRGLLDLARSEIRAGQAVGRYRVLSLIGAGGMGEVYLAEDPRLGRRVAVKLLQSDLGRDPRRLQRFEQEARAASALSHPNVCVVYEIAEADDGRPFLAMEYIEGESVRHLLERHRGAGTRLPLSEALDVATQAAAGLAAAHAVGIVHRDVKPENVMRRPDGLTKVLDFGLAKLPSRHAASARRPDGAHSVHTEPGMVLGTVQYMSPEQARGLPVDARTDVWSLGAVLYEMLAGRPPFEGATATDVLVAVLEREPPALAALSTSAPAALQELVGRALRKSREERWPSMSEMAAALAQCRRTLEAGVSSQSPVRAAVRAPAARGRPHRQRALRAAAGAAALAALGGAVAVRARAPDRLPQRVVVVTTFDNASADPSLASVGRLLGDYFAEGFGSLDSVGVADRDATLRAERAETAPAGAGGSRREAALLDVARRVGAGVLVSGAFYPVSDSLQVQVRLVDANTGEVIRALRPERVPRHDPTGGLATLRQRVLGGLALLNDATFGAAMLPAGDPPMLAAYLDVRGGLETQAALRPRDAGAGEDLSELVRFDRAVAVDTGYLQARLWFASAALRRFGGESLADSVLVAVSARADLLTPFERAMLDALRADAAGSNEASARAWRRAATTSRSWPARWWLANKLRDANRPREALGVLDSLGRQDPHFLRAAPSVLHYLGQHDRELSALRAEGARSPQAVQSLDYQQALLQALAALDSADAVLRTADGLTSLAAEGGTSVAHLLTRTAWELRAHGSGDAGAAILERAAAWCRTRTTRDLRNEALRFDCAEAYGATGRWADARRAVEADLRAHPGDLGLLALLGVAAATRAERGVADSISGLIAARSRDDGSRGFPEWVRARIAASLGEREAAVSLLRDAFARGATWQFRLDLHRDPAFESLRTYPPFQQLMRPQG